eukprot:Tamp_07218.p1 GENE.Tamp_07218~~Tamp_07218.p1  ORF type:complete len:462 (-),score=85.12 Tamp_07218:1145-2530(-)
MPVQQPGSNDSSELVVDSVQASTSSENDVEDELKNMCIGEKDEDEEVDADSTPTDAFPSGDLGEKQKRPQSAFRRGLSGISAMYNSAKKVVARKDSAEDAARYQQLQLLITQCRHALAHPKGGLINDDYQGITKSRGVLAEVVKQIGKKILRGQNVMGVSFPVRCCQPRTILECAAYQFVFCPHYLQLAAKAADPVERLKHVTAAFIACIHTTSQFVKPFNPVLGETLQATFQGGVNLFVEQTSHHPPVTSWLLEGPNKSFKYYGWSTYEASFGYNKLFVKQSGLRRIEFADGCVIDLGFTQDKYNNALWGDVVHEVLGAYKFSDQKNQLVCTVGLNPSSSLPSDAFVGQIERVDAQGNPTGAPPLASLQGSFLGFLDFDGKRLWDITATATRTDPNFVSAHLPSDSRTREDRNALVTGDEDLAQTEKVRIEERQRRERRLRAAGSKARESGSNWTPADVK